MLRSVRRYGAQIPLLFRRAHGMGGFQHVRRDLGMIERTSSSSPPLCGAVSSPCSTCKENQSQISIRQRRCRALPISITCINEHDSFDHCHSRRSCSHNARQRGMLLQILSCAILSMQFTNIAIFHHIYIQELRLPLLSWTPPKQKTRKYHTHKHTPTTLSSNPSIRSYISARTRIS